MPKGRTFYARIHFILVDKKEKNEENFYLGKKSENWYVNDQNLTFSYWNKVGGRDVDSVNENHLFRCTGNSSFIFSIFGM